MVGVEPLFVGHALALVPDDRLIRARAVDVAAQEVAAGVVFGDELGAVVEELGGGAGDRGFLQAAFGVVVEAGCCAGFVGGFEAVVGVEGVGPGAVSGEVAVGVVLDFGGADLGVLVLAVAAVVDAGVGGFPFVFVVGPGVLGDLAQLVAGVVPGDVVTRAGEVVVEAGEAALRGVGVAACGGVGEACGGATVEGVEGEAGEREAAVFFDRSEPVGGVELAGDVEAIRPGGADAVAGGVELVAYRALIGSGSGEPAGGVPGVSDHLPPVGKARFGAPAGEVVGEAEIVRRGGVIAGDQAVEVVEVLGDALAATAGDRGEVAVGAADWNLRNPNFKI